MGQDISTRAPYKDALWEGCSKAQDLFNRFPHPLMGVDRAWKVI